MLRLVSSNPFPHTNGASLTREQRLEFMLETFSKLVTKRRIAELRGLTDQVSEIDGALQDAALAADLLLKPNPPGAA